MSLGRRSRPRLLAAGALVGGWALVLSGCSLGPAAAPPAPAPASGASASSPSESTSGSATGSATPSADNGRPVEAVPNVKPKGFVDPPPGQGLARYPSQKLSWTTCGELQCASVAVPLDYAHPDGQAITLALARRRATAKPRLGSLFLNPGGPGGSGLGYAKDFNPEGLERYDIVGWDPRGVGQSTPVTCFDKGALDDYLARDTSPDTPAEDAALRTEERAFGRSCLVRSGALLQHVSTEETVRDLDVLRQLVGDPRLDYFGSSYGTDIGALYAQLYPKLVGRMVLDGAVNIAPKDTVSQTEGFERALTTFAGWCAERTCKLGGTQQQVLDRIATFLRNLDSQPMPGGRRPLTQQLAVTGVVFVLYEPKKYWGYLQQALEGAIVEHSPQQLLYYADGYDQRDNQTGTFGQANFSFPAVRCLDSQDTTLAAVRKKADQDKAKAPVLGSVSGPDYTCVEWPVAPAPKQPTITGDGAPPILVVGTTGDPATPYEYAQQMAHQLKSGVLVTLKGEGHLAYAQSPCIQRIVVAYLVRGEVPQDGVTCSS